MRACRHACAGLLLACANPAWTQGLQDPTRPPAGLMTPQAGAGDIGSGAKPDRAPRLQSVLVARQPGGRHVAVIDGETLRLGDTFRGARVARIGQNEVELRRGNARQVLTLHAAAASNAGAIERVKNE